MSSDTSATSVSASLISSNRDDDHFGTALIGTDDTTTTTTTTTKHDRSQPLNELEKIESDEGTTTNKATARVDGTTAVSRTLQPSNNDDRPGHEQEQEQQAPTYYRRFHTDKYDDVLFSILDKSTWTKEPVHKRVAYPEIDELIGWATHVVSAKRPPCDDSVNNNSDANNAHAENPLLVLPNVPPPPSHLLYLSKMGESIARRKNKDELYEKLEHSSLMTLGYLVDAVMTAALAPYAAKHVERCRKIDDENEDNTGTDEWTIPPEEAIMKVMSESSAVTLRELCLPSAMAPTHASKYTKTNAGSRAPARPFAQWCKSQQLSRNYVRRNSDQLFSVFLQQKPDIDGDRDSDVGA